MHDPKLVAEGFRQAEANCRLEGFKPEEDSFYQELKARVIAGEITSEQATQLIVAKYTQAPFHEADPAFAVSAA